MIKLLVMNVFMSCSLAQSRKNEGFEEERGRESIEPKPTLCKPKRQELEGTVCSWRTSHKMKRKELKRDAGRMKIGFAYLITLSGIFPTPINTYFS